MALKMAITTDFGLEIKDAYIKIDSVCGRKEKITLDLSAYHDHNGTYKRIQRIEPVPVGAEIVGVFQFESSVATTAKNIFKQGYEYLKTLDQFKNAVDA